MARERLSASTLAAGARRSPKTSACPRYLGTVVESQEQAVRAAAAQAVALEQTNLVPSLGCRRTSCASVCAALTTSGASWHRRVPPARKRDKLLEPVPGPFPAAGSS
mmetsp:Transcript_7439/g.13978  ORF Transcript_7439/g.13978 Transcript_7439/m.13978 type:complete len:107 (+) Transcript_7439:178-498(+)